MNVAPILKGTDESLILNKTTSLRACHLFRRTHNPAPHNYVPGGAMV